MMNYPSPNKQKGAAAILFILIFPALFAVFIWGIEGARMLQSSARLTDANESAILAMTASDTTDNTVLASIAKNFVEAYFPTGEVTIPTATRTACLTTECDESSESLGVSQLAEYKLSVNVTENSWFPNSSLIADEYDQFSVSDSITARKGKPEAVDVVLVASYAATMSKNYTALTNIIVKIAEDLKTYNQATGLESKLAVVGYDHYVSQMQTQLELKIKWCGLLPCFYYESVPVRVFYHNLRCDVSSNSNNSSNSKNCMKGNSYDESDIFNLSKVNAATTVANIFSDDSGSSSSNDKTKAFERWLAEILSTYFSFLGSNNPFSSWYAYNHNHSLYETISLTSEFTDLQALVKNTSRFNMVSSNIGSASYTGLIEGARVALGGDNPRRIIILLSDGEEHVPVLATNLVAAGLCSEIIETLDKQLTSDGSAVKSEIKIIGFNYNATKGAGLAGCVDKVYDSSNTEAINNEVLNFSAAKSGYLVQ